MEQLAFVDQHVHEVTSKILNIVGFCEKFDGIYSRMFMDKNVVVDNPYGFRLLVKEKSNDVVLFEPTLVLDLKSHQLQTVTHAYLKLESFFSGLNVLVKTYFVEVFVETYEKLNSLKV